MPIDWLDAESAIDQRNALEGRRATLEAEYHKDRSNGEAALRLLVVLDQLEVNPQEMTRLVEPAFQANPKDPALLAWLAQLSFRLGEWKLAMLTAKHACDLDPGDVMANFTLAQILLRGSRPQDGIKFAQKALDGGAAAHYRDEIERVYLITLARLKRFDEAWKLQSEKLAARPGDAQAAIDAADLRREMGRPAEGRELLEAAHRRMPRNTDLLFRLATGAFEDGDNAGALHWADQLLEADGQHLEGWHLRAQARLALGDPERALQDHEMIRELSRKTPLDQAFRAQCLVALGRRDEAIAGLKQGIAESADWFDRKCSYEAELAKLTVQPPEARRAAPKTAPNAPCWCGSGRKFKKCHGVAA
ncbi:MAG: SEC-C domain-containing protein [Planctomycetes bacterium]|nr:SEC-C domain-containing protein [Planctomycetota bacterium]